MKSRHKKLGAVGSAKTFWNFDILYYLGFKSATNFKTCAFPSLFRTNYKLSNYLSNTFTEHYIRISWKPWGSDNRSLCSDRYLFLRSQLASPQNRVCLNYTAKSQRDTIPCTYMLIQSVRYLCSILTKKKQNISTKFNKQTAHKKIPENPPGMSCYVACRWTDRQK